MISAWFLIPALMVGAAIGIAIICLIQMNDLADDLDQPLETISKERVKEMIRFAERNKLVDENDLGV